MKKLKREPTKLEILKYEMKRNNRRKFMRLSLRMRLKSMLVSKITILLVREGKKRRKSSKQF